MWISRTLIPHGEIRVVLELDVDDTRQLRKVMLEAAALGTDRQHYKAKLLAEFLGHMLDVDRRMELVLP